MALSTPLRRAIAGVGIAGASVAGWSLLEARWPVLRVVELPVLKSGGPLRVLHLSDLHAVGSHTWLRDFVTGLGRTKPDLIVSTGDNFSDLSALPRLREIYAPLLRFPGVFVFGSNDYYSPQFKSPTRYLRRSHQPPRRNVPDLPFAELADFLEGGGWVQLTNRGALLNLDLRQLRNRRSRTLTLALNGVDDPHIKRDRLQAPPAGWAEADLRLGLTHAPYQRLLNGLTDQGADVILAGHTHGGQICIPGYGALVTNCDLPPSHVGGAWEWHSPNGNRSWVHVSRGLGTNRYTPIRLACRPEATLLVLTAPPQTRS